MILLLVPTGFGGKYHVHSATSAFASLSFSIAPPLTFGLAFIDMLDQPLKQQLVSSPFYLTTVDGKSSLGERVGIYLPVEPLHLPRLRV